MKQLPPISPPPPCRATHSNATQPGTRAHCAAHSRSVSRSEQLPPPADVLSGRPAYLAVVVVVVVVVVVALLLLLVVVVVET